MVTVQPSCIPYVTAGGTPGSALARRGDPHIARAVAAWLCRRHSEVPLRELALLLGLSRANSVPNLTRHMDATDWKGRLNDPSLVRRTATIRGW